MGRDAEGPDAAWLEEECQRRREAWEVERPQRRLARRSARRAEPLSRRMHRLEVQLAVSSGMPAAAIGGRSGGTPDSQAPPDAVVAFGGEHPAELARLLSLLERVVEKLEALADPDPQEPLAGTDLDRLLVSEFEGMSAEDVSALDPLFGSPEAVRRARRRAGRSGYNGTVCQ